MSIPTFNLDLSSLIIIGLTAAIGGRFVAALLIPDMRPPNVGEVLLGVGFIGFYLFLQHLPWQSWQGKGKSLTYFVA